MERGSVVEIRAMSGRVKRTDGANGGSVCSEVKEKECGGGGGDGVAHGEVMDVQLKMDQ